MPLHVTSNTGNIPGGSLTYTEAKIYSIDLPFLDHNLLYICPFGSFKSETVFLVFSL